MQLIPNFVPLLGQLDDVLVAIVGGWLAVKLIPPELLDEFRSKAQAREPRPISWAGAITVAVLWFGAAVAGSAVVWRLLGAR